MKLRELIHNQDFDVNCYYAIYDCRDGKYWGEKETPDAVGFCHADIPDKLLDLNVTYITIDNIKSIIVIEVA